MQFLLEAFENLWCLQIIWQVILNLAKDYKPQIVIQNNAALVTALYACKQMLTEKTPIRNKAMSCTEIQTSKQILLILYNAWKIILGCFSIFYCQSNLKEFRLQIVGMNIQLTLNDFFN